jgi:SAM-dependent methyltransferase
MMAREFARLLGPRGGYVGFDSHPPSIRWCRSRFRGDSRFRFEIAAAGVSPDGPLRFPIESGHAGFILAKSVFTHLTEEDARGCLTEIRRALAPGATALVTAFLFDGAAGSGSSAAYFPFSNAEGSVRWRWRARPRSAIAFDRVMFEGIIQRCGLRVALFRSGFWPGAAEPTGQDILFLVHRDGETRPASRAAPKTP